MPYYLLGKTLGHSFSPDIHALLGNPDYTLLPMPEDDLAPFFRAREFDGLNITIPYKRTIMPFLDVISPEATEADAVNAVVNRGGVLTGYNTDIDGFSAALEVLDPRHAFRTALILGSGATSAMIATVLKKRGYAISVCSRRGELNYENAYDRCPSPDLLVNATPVGMFPANGEAAVDLTKFKSVSAVFDVVYNPLRTALLLQAEKLSIPFENGLRMLVMQAVRAHEHFFGTRVTAEKSADVLRIMRAKVANVIFIGMPGSGKSTFARSVSEVLNRPLVDTDTETERLLGAPIPDVIRNAGETFFRDAESKAVAQEGKTGGKVIATGGGAVLRQANVDALRQNGFVIFLDRTPDSLPTEGRPLSSGGIETLRRMAAERRPFYEKACDISIANDSDRESVLKRILDSLRKEGF